MKESEKMSLAKIGEVIDYDGKKLMKLEAGPVCEGCYFDKNDKCTYPFERLLCTAPNNQEGEDIIFKEVTEDKVVDQSLEEKQSVSDTTSYVAVMQAFINGDKIQCKARDKGVWRDVDTPIWNWYEYIYRIVKEEPTCKWVPYNTIEEVLEALKEHGPFIHYSNLPGEYEAIISTYGNAIKTFTSTMTFRELLDNCVWQDGTKCGKEVLC